MRMSAERSVCWCRVSTKSTSAFGQSTTDHFNVYITLRYQSRKRNLYGHPVISILAAQLCCPLLVIGVGQSPSGGALPSQHRSWHQRGPAHEGQPLSRRGSSTLRAELSGNHCIPSLALTHRHYLFNISFMAVSDLPRRSRRYASGAKF
jgi:hypothetical protein